MDTDSFIISCSEGNIPDELDLSNLDIQIKANNKVPGQFEHEFGAKIIDEYIIYLIKNI